MLIKANENELVEYAFTGGLDRSSNSGLTIFISFSFSFSDDADAAESGEFSIIVKLVQEDRENPPFS